MEPLSPPRCWTIWNSNVLSRLWLMKTRQEASRTKPMWGCPGSERLAFLLGSLLGSLLGGGLWLRFRGREAGGRGLEAEGQDRNK